MGEREKPFEILPNSLPHVTRNEVRGMFGVGGKPIYCANCGADGGWVPTVTDFAFYLCEPCHAKLPSIEGTYAVPDEVFFAKVAEEQQAQFGRPATHLELMRALDDSENPLTKLGRDRARGK